MMRSLVLISGALCLLGAFPAEAQQASPPCDSVPGFRALDFWLGEWDVRVGDAVVGTNTIEKILNGCALMEHWRDARGGEGKSLFYFDQAADVWTQVWITDKATAPGGLKVKTMLAQPADGSVRFQGRIALPDGRSYLDRTTLTPLGDDRVRQVIEISVDSGATWERRFDAVYVPRR